MHPEVKISPGFHKLFIVNHSYSLPTTLLNTYPILCAAGGGKVRLCVSKTEGKLLVLEVKAPPALPAANFLPRALGLCQGSWKRRLFFFLPLSYGMFVGRCSLVGELWDPDPCSLWLPGITAGRECPCSQREAPTWDCGHKGSSFGILWSCWRGSREDLGSGGAP